MHRIYLGLGSNLGDKEKNLVDGINEINSRIGTIESRSDFLQTIPWGFASENMFVNAVVCVLTDLQPMELLEATQAIETDLGRKKKSIDGVYHDRVIDIDILLYDDLQFVSRRLTIPHPLMLQREFVLKPLAQIAPSLVVPTQTKTIAQRLSDINTL